MPSHRLLLLVRHLCPVSCVLLQLLALMGLCKCVLACRVSPEQKRLMVRLVKRGSTTKAAATAVQTISSLPHSVSSYFDGSSAGQ